METRLPKVLVVGINAWREDASSHTLKNIFSCWDPERLAHIYTRSELPDTTVASSEQAIYEMIKFLCDNPESIDVYSRKAYDCAVKNHEKEMIDRRFYEPMLNATK